MKEIKELLRPDYSLNEAENYLYVVYASYLVAAEDGLSQKEIRAIKHALHDQCGFEEDYVNQNYISILNKLYTSIEFDVLLNKIQTIFQKDSKTKADYVKLVTKIVGTDGFSDREKMFFNRLVGLKERFS